MNTTAHPHLYLITGASRGLGLAMASQLLAPSNHLVCISRHGNAALAAQASSLSAALEQWELDLAQPQQAAQRVQAWLDQHRNWSSATLINNAGVVASSVPLQSAQAEDLSLALRVGLEAPMLLCSAFLRATRDWGVPRRVLNISSGLGRRALASQAAYCAAKAGMDHFTRCAALEEAQHAHGARLCSLAPGVIDTDMQAQLRNADAQLFPGREAFVTLKSQGQLSSPAQTATRVLDYLARADFGSQPVADVREV